ncbi:hypothetical protein ACOI1C_12530 [Bacillus sp. DJP31]|uniref:hypothetical protein n=1 Tax=Bacillus sp. DJP31 TaxID=3409789 RepID=UPI003BB71F77
MEKSSRPMPALSTATDALKETSFSIIGHETFLIQPSLQDFFLYSGKYEPALYLEEKVRSGISTFANLASDREGEEGC